MHTRSTLTEIVAMEHDKNWDSVNPFAEELRVVKRVRVSQFEDNDVHSFVKNAA